jgi:thiol-disulfide isomerase/thioredoxin
MRWSSLSAVLLVLVTELCVADDLDVYNFDSLVFESSKQAAWIKFYAPWCQHCQKLAPKWRKVEKKHAETSSLLLGSVNCADGPNRRNPLCDTYRVASMPTLMFFYPPSKKGSVFEGNQTVEDLVAFADELGSPCSLFERDECTEEQKAWLDQYDAMSLSKLKEAVSDMDDETERAKMSFMMIQMEMQEKYKKMDEEGSLSKEDKEEALRPYEPSLVAANEKVSEEWARSAELRAMKIVLRGKRRLQKARKAGYGSVAEHEAAMKAEAEAEEAARVAAEKAAAEKAAAEKRAAEKAAAERLAACKDAGPWPCKEEGCPSPLISCKDLKSDCKKKFRAVWENPPQGLGDTRIWKSCRRSCNRCDEKDEL